MARSKYFVLLLAPQWKAKREKILKRDNNSCRKCGKKKDLHVHHKYYLSGKKPWEYPDDALTTLCKGCHKKEHDNKDIKDFTKKKARKEESKSNFVPPKKKKIDTPFSQKEFAKRKATKNIAQKGKDAVQKRNERRLESPYYSLPEYEHLKTGT